MELQANAVKSHWDCAYMSRETSERWVVRRRRRDGGGDRGGYKWSEKRRKEDACGTCLLAADQTSESCNPSWSNGGGKKLQILLTGEGRKRKARGGKGALAQNKPCQEPELQGSCLKMRGEKNRNLTQDRGNYLKDNAQGEGEREKNGGRIVGGGA